MKVDQLKCDRPAVAAAGRSEESRPDPVGYVNTNPQTPAAIMRDDIVVDKHGLLSLSQTGRSGGPTVPPVSNEHWLKPDHDGGPHHWVLVEYIAWLLHAVGYIFLLHERVDPPHGCLVVAALLHVAMLTILAMRGR